MADVKSLPDWQGFTPVFAESELPRLMAAAEASVTAIEREQPTDYDGLFVRLNDATRDLWRCYGRVSHMTGVMNSEAWRAVEEKFQPKIVAFSLRVSQSPVLYRLMKSLSEDVSSALDPIRRRIVEKAVQSAELAGVGLEGEAKARFNEIQTELAKLAMDFHNAVIDATKAFSYEKDGKTYTIDDANYPETMKHCSDREVRETLYRARVTRAPENEARIGEILRLRAEEARMLDFANFAELSLAKKCAPSVGAVADMIDRLDRATAALADRERLALGDANLAPWDIAYAAERLRERTYDYSEDELKRYFELEDVLRGLFRMTEFLFGVSVIERAGADRPIAWHEDVRYFDVFEDGRLIAGFYFDPFVRNGLKGGGAWMNEFRGRRCGGELPLAVIVTNFPLREADGRCLLPFREVETLFHEFGHALQHMLTRIEEEDAAGINLVEWDAVEVASQFMENWCLDDRTGICVPPELKAKVRAAKNFRAASVCRRQLAFAKLDLDLHAEAPCESVTDRQRTVFAHFGLPTIPEDRFLCAFTHIFAGGYAAGYYGYKWAEVMSADCYGAFEEGGLQDDDAQRRIGRRYRETILALGGSESALSVFQRFRGRAPQIDSLLRQQDLI